MTSPEEIARESGSEEGGDNGHVPLNADFIDRTVHHLLLPAIRQQPQ